MHSTDSRLSPVLRGWCSPLAIAAISLLPWNQANLVAHDGPHDKPQASAASDPQAAGQDNAQQTIGSGLILPRIEGPKPWSTKPALTDPNRFSIAIMTDRTGGHRPGIWMKAVERVNWLRPDFVVSVGDLIEGYTEEDAEIERQWQEFLGFIDQLQMKFFFVAGNHDVTNPKLHRVWREKFGAEWYSFDYKGVHFVCLSSEDPSAHLGQDQLNWLAQDLAEHQDARWTLVFLHKPLWTYAEREISAGNEDPTNWTRAAELLVGRPHTVFAGHVHHYVQYQRNAGQYYSLATTGGSSRLRGLPYGEFDHITWLTMEQDGPHVANLLLDGIQPADIVTEESIDGFREFLEQVHIEIEPILISENALSSGEIRLKLQNDYHSAVTVDASINGLPLVGLDMKSQTLQLSASAGKAVHQVVPFAMKEAVALERFRLTTLTATVTSADTPPLQAEWTVPVIIDRQFEIRRLKVTLDGNLKDWEQTTWWATEPSPAWVGNGENWTGPEDAALTLSASYDDNRIYFAAKVQDDTVMTGDAVSLAVDPRPFLSRVARNRLGRETIAVTIQAPDHTEVGPCSMSAATGRRTSDLPMSAVGRRTAHGYEFEVAVPIDNLLKAQGADWDSIQVGARLSDVDAEEDAAVEVLWRASPNRNENRSFAHVVRQ